MTNEKLYKFTGEAFAFLNTNIHNHISEYNDPNVNFHDILSKEYPDHTYREDTGITVERFPNLICENPTRRNTADEQCMGFYRSFKGMTPLIASEPRVLAYINHFYLHKFSISRWKNTSKNERSFIENHWLSSSRTNILKWNTAGRLWWMAYMAVKAADASYGVMTEEAIVKMFANNAEYYHRTIEYEATMNRKLLAECLHILIMNEGIPYQRYMSMLRTINREGGARLLDALESDDLKKLVKKAFEQSADHKTKTVNHK